MHSIEMTSSQMLWNEEREENLMHRSRRYFGAVAGADGLRGRNGNSALSDVVSNLRSRGKKKNQKRST